MSECRFCNAVSEDGEPTKHYSVTGMGELHFRQLCKSCADSLRHLGLQVREEEP